MENESKTDIINNLQCQKERAIYTMPDLEACTDIGKLREKQEDAVLLLPRLDNPQFKLVAVADGMGGYVNGAQASNLALLELIYWFEKLPLNYFYSEAQLFQALEPKINEIDALIRKRCGEGGTTLALAITCQSNTVFINVGDSRIYIQKKYDLEQISNDHSLCFELYEKAIIEEKDDIRFHKRNNLINSRLGGFIKMLKLEKIILQNSDYDQALLFTDGVTDCLSDKQLTDLVNNDKLDLAPAIVNAALSTNSYNDYLETDEYYDMIEAGKDNATAAILAKKYRGD